MNRSFLFALFIGASCCLGTSFPPVTAADKQPQPEFDPAHAEKMQEGLTLFKQTVRTVLIKQCTDCHGGDEVQSGFDLATRKGLLRGGSKGPAVSIGKSLDSNLLRFISRREKPFMPEGSDKLPDDAIAAIAKWIDLGAPYDQPLVDNPRDPDLWTKTVVGDKARDFWSLKQLHRTEPPSVKNEAWVRTPIDRFVLVAAEAKGITPNAVATKQTLLRRAYFDLIGLPPTPDEIAMFLADDSPQAFEKVIDQLLESPHYGERWGRHWLDTARFAESHGFEQDYDRPFAFHFRDFVIKALNQDMPYDQFVRWQLAGDELAPDEPLALMATGFLGAGVFPTQITANEVEKSRYDALDDMAATTGSALLGLSIGCARCHDHKFDPIPAADYYRFIATFATTVRSNVDLNLKPAEYRAAKATFDQAHAPFVTAREKFEKEQLPGRFASWEKSSGAQELQNAAWRVLSLKQLQSKGKATLTLQSDGSALATGTNPDFDVYTLTAELPAGTYHGIRLEALADPSLKKNGPGRAANGNFALTDLRVVLKQAGKPDQTLSLQNPQATFEQKPSLLVKHTIDSDQKSAWAVDPQFGKDHAAVYELAEPLTIDKPATLTFTLEFNNNKQHNIGRPRISITSSPAPLAVETGGLAAGIAAALAIPADKRTAKQQEQLLAWYRAHDDEWKRLNQAEQDHLAKAPQPTTVKVMVCSEGVTPIRHHTQGADFFTETYFLKRGDNEQKMGQATPGFLQVLTSAPQGEKHWQVTPPAGAKTSHRRTALAAWITDTEYGAGHLLARVMANRLWHHHFGRGLVATPNDFGVQGERPTHPELLDWLASELMARGWKLKTMHKLIMTSAAYQQASTFDPADAKLDPENKLLWRFSPRRLEAEIVRDNLLAVSGALDRTQFGAGSLEETHRRRSIYFTIKRSKLVPMMQLFDQPEPLVSVGGRPSTTIAPQALMLLNNPQVRLYAHSFAKQLLPAAEKDMATATRQAYLQAIAREPDAAELREATAFLAEQELLYQADKKPNAKELALADFCQVLFGLNEFVYVE
ncbi:Planctomycete cytochrome C [Anatilimnocola aggregata]|uniref:Planctomycete cytochrome C n=1 Tax=Anatilimnocola aggregata TaxID=2528021 RepID=A0A517Y8C1_9BACT|nr:PSD1 and planctomycete cytochrome C domain-containing protein [Anatilimnocola aggregata]QDU26499.1 Planctomycete cytochrome C [Anatilimnocola aggregata]